MEPFGGNEYSDNDSLLDLDMESNDSKEIVIIKIEKL